MRLFAFFLVTALAGAPCAALADDWQMVIGTPSGASLRGIDAESITEGEGGNRQADVLVVYLEPRQIADQVFISHLVSREEIVCSGLAHRVLELRAYDADNVLLAASPADEDFSPIAPNSVDHLMLRSVCSGEGLTTGSGLPTIPLAVDYARERLSSLQN